MFGSFVGNERCKGRASTPWARASAGLRGRLPGWVAARRSVLRVFWPLPVAVSGWLAAALISGGALLPHKATYTWVLGGFTAAIVLSAVLARAPRFRPRAGVAIGLAATAF